MKQPKNWGWYKHNGSDTYRFDPGKNVNDFNKITEPTDGLLIKYGNDFGPEWIDHTSIPHDNWYFYDNPELPHLLYPNPANPMGRKEWVRLVPNNILTQTKTGSGSDRVNRMLTELAGQPLVWQDLVYPRDTVWSNSKRVLVCASSPNCYIYYYNTTASEWTEWVCRELRKHGYEPVLRNKPSRTLRTKTSDSRLYQQLASGDYIGTVSQHSVSAMETLLAGYPAITTGPHPCGELATPFEEFLQGDLTLPQSDDIEDWVDGLLYNTRHKTEMRSGSWHNDLQQ